MWRTIDKHLANLTSYLINYKGVVWINKMREEGITEALRKKEARWLFSRVHIRTSICKI